MPHALLVEDDAASLEALERLVQRHGFTTVPAQTVEQARKEIDACAPELAIVDLDLPDGNGLELLDQLRSGFDAEVVVVTGHGAVDTAVAALHGGALEYLEKPIDTEQFARVLNNVKRTLSLRKEVMDLRAELRRLGRFDKLVGSSPAMQRVYDLIARVSPTSSTVLLVGETGTGKDLVAETIHRHSRRANGRFVAINCGAVQESLIESEIFGHEAGSFTGADRRRRGVFEQADGGTLFLDEITEMPIELQVKLLRVLENRVVQRVGGERAVRVDVRLIAATNRDPERAMKEGTLREDLYYRLRVFPIPIPPLRDRRDDIEVLASYFLAELNEEAEVQQHLSGGSLDRLRVHDWPGNVRQLRNVIERASILAGPEIKEEHVELDAPVAPRPKQEGIRIEIGQSIAEAEKELILATLDSLGGNKRSAAEMLGISLKTLYNRLNRYGMGRSDAKQATERGA